MKAEEPIRCTCDYMLGACGINEDGLIYVHVIIRKQSDVKSQIYTTTNVSVWCSGCGLWTHLILNQDDPIKKEEILTPKPLRNRRGFGARLPTHDSDR